MKIFDFIDYCYFLLREFLIFIDSKLVHASHLLLTMSTNQLRIGKNNNSLKNNSTFTKFENPRKLGDLLYS